MLGIERHSDEAFFTRLYNMVDNPATDSIASWSPSGKSFIVWNPDEFTKDVMFFIRYFYDDLLRSYKFRRVGSEPKKYANDHFVRGQPQLMKNIPRRGFFITREDVIEVNNVLTREKEELLTELRKQELLIKELKYHLQIMNQPQFHLINT